MEQQKSITLTRRRAVTVGAAAAAGAVGVAGLAGCGGSSSTASDAGASSAAPPAGSSAATSTAAGGSDSAALAKLSDVPVGGVLVVKDASGAPLVLAQPTAGQVVGLSGKCTHQGCAVAADGKGGLKCPCHGATYDASGAVLAGPATAPLPTVAVKVDGQNVVAG